MIRYITIFIFIFGFFVQVIGQEVHDVKTGKITFVTRQNVYIKFKSTAGIEVGDTLFVRQGDKLFPAVLVNHKSSTSCVGKSIFENGLSVADKLVAKLAISVVPPEVSPGLEEPIVTDVVRLNKYPDNHSDEPAEKQFTQQIKGRFSAASYSNLSSLHSKHKMRYAVILGVQNISDSKFSIDSRIYFRQSINLSTDRQESFGDRLKVYSLNIKYEWDDNSSVFIGRKINPRISNIGAMDGIQLEKGVRNFRLGFFGGSRPDYKTYGFNPNLWQLGSYVTLVSNNKKIYHQSTFAIAEQRNGGKTDRRFAYFQHSNSLTRNLSSFLSFEMDLFENIDNNPKSSIQLTNLYFSLRYRYSRKLTFSASYDNRKNIIYYESYKNSIDRLIDDETRQGFRIGFRFRPSNAISWGIQTNWRFQNTDSNNSRNINSYISFNKIPLSRLRTTISINLLQNHFLESKIIGVRTSLSLIPGKLDGNISYRMVDYSYKNYEKNTRQNIASANLSYRFWNDMTVHVYYEGIYSNQSNTYHRLNLKVIRRF